MNKKRLNNAGFTLIELLAVITIMGILMMVAIPAVSRTIENSRRDSFATVAQNYVNAVRNSVLADEFECETLKSDGSACTNSAGGTNTKVTVSGTPNGVYYFAIDSDQQSSQDLMESGGTSSWGGAKVTGFVVWQKADQSTAGGTQSTTKTTYKISLVDTGKHGIKTYETDQKITRAKVVTNGANTAAPANEAFGTPATTDGAGNPVAASTVTACACTFK